VKEQSESAALPPIKSGGRKKKKKKMVKRKGVFTGIGKTINIREKISFPLKRKKGEGGGGEERRGLAGATDVPWLLSPFIFGKKKKRRRGRERDPGKSNVPDALQ